ncbi:uncharacterized protein LOC144453767 [Glandiceps talaboti]
MKIMMYRTTFMVTVLFLLCTNTSYGRDVPYIGVGDYELYEVLDLPICSVDGGGFGVTCAALFAGTPDGQPYGTCHDILPECDPLADCLDKVCTSRCGEGEDYFNFCYMKEFIEYVLDEGGIPSIGLPIEQLMSVLMNTGAAMNLEWCDGYSIKCAEHPDGCVWLEDICRSDGTCYCNLDELALEIEYMKNLPEVPADF